MPICTLAPHSVRPAAGDKIFDLSQKAKKAAAQFGDEAVVNSTLGECIGDDGRLMVLPVVEEAIRSQTPDDMFRYAPITGVPGFREAVIQQLLGGDTHGWFIEAVPTPGGCGALRNMVWNFLEAGESALTTQYHWGPVKKICLEHGRRLETFRMFDESGTFDLESLRARLLEIAARQPRILLILNTPANNPTGYSMTCADMRGVAGILREAAAAYPDHMMTLCLDVSYIDYAGSFEQTRAIFREIEDLPGNCMATVVWSMSKSFTMCGMRCGASVCLAGSQEAASQFRDAMAYSARATWSNVIRSAQKCLVDIVLNPALKAKADAQRAEFAAVIDGRARVFLEEAAKAGVACRPYDHGFFVTVTCPDPDALVAELQKDLVFAVPQSDGIRFSVCAVSTDKCRRVPGLIAAALRRLG